MSASRTLAVIALPAALLAACSRPGDSPRQPFAPRARSAQPARDPQVEPLLSHLAIDPASGHLLAVSRQERTIGAVQISTRLWIWSHQLTRRPGFVAVHHGQGFLVWESAGGGAELVRFLPATGDTVATLSLGTRSVEDFRASAFDPTGLSLFLATSSEILGVDLAANRLLPPRSFPGVIDLAVDAPRAQALISHLKGLTVLGLAGQPGAEIELPSVPGGLALDPDRGLLYVVTGSNWLEIDLESRAMARQGSFEPRHGFSGARLALAPACGRLYLAAGALVEVDLENGRWDSIVTLGSSPAPLLHLPTLGALFTLHDGRIYSSYHPCPAVEQP